MEAKEQHHVPVDNRRAVDTNLIVATLIATVTFAASFIVPGRFNGDEGLDRELSRHLW